MDVATDPVQVESPSSVTKATSWASLPVEVRQMILSLVVLPISGGKYNGLGSRNTSVPIAMNRRMSNNMIFTTCIQSLLGTLKLWNPARHGAEGLALMLSASSPSDTEHRFNRCEIKDGYPFHYAEDLDLAPGIVDFHRANIADPFTRHFHRGCPPPLYSEHVKRVQGTSLRLEPRRDGQGRFISQYKSLPAVPIIKGLIMRRQFRRDFHECSAYIFRYSYEDGRASIVWRSCEETLMVQARIIAKWGEVAQKLSHSTFAYNVVPFAETKADISNSDGTCIYQHLLLKDLVFDPITQIILENEPYEWSLGKKSDSSQQGNLLNSNLASPNSLSGDQLMYALGPNVDLALLQADLMAFDAEVTAFLQQHYG
ncbi:uncharacterized protein TrAFT101_011694 [Trichoderma asperellum]|uniref:uncharacterized protein n=1 Tax=Trichoderma asperellum TaxID=101201 RepID=UPI003324270B|nr:hypothetical protein TrAFT101_011694 [Trichoderma asperellum]